MPTYSYRCTHCNHAFDIHQAFTDDNLAGLPRTAAVRCARCSRRSA